MHGGQPVRRWELLSTLEVSHLKEWLPFAGDFEGPHCATLRPRPLLSLVALAKPVTEHTGYEPAAAPWLPSLETSTLSGLNGSFEGHRCHRLPFHLSGETEAQNLWLRGGEPGEEQGLPAWGVASVCSSFPAPAPGGPQASQGVQVVACVMFSPRELAAAFPLLTQSQPACWAF